MKRLACLLILLLAASTARATILLGPPQVSFYVEYGSDLPPFLDAATFSCFSPPVRTQRWAEFAGTTSATSTH